LCCGKRDAIPFLVLSKVFFSPSFNARVMGRHVRTSGLGAGREKRKGLKWSRICEESLCRTRSGWGISFSGGRKGKRGERNSADRRKEGESPFRSGEGEKDALYRNRNDCNGKSGKKEKDSLTF